VSGGKGKGWRGCVEEGRRLGLLRLLCLMRAQVGAGGGNGCPLLLFIVVK